MRRTEFIDGTGSFAEIEAQEAPALARRRVRGEARPQIVRRQDHLARRVEVLIQVEGAKARLIPRRTPDALDLGAHIAALFDPGREPGVRRLPCRSVVYSRALRCRVDVRHGRGVAQNLGEQGRVAPDADMDDPPSILL